MDNRQPSLLFCCFPSFPVSRPRESVQEVAPEYSSARELPPYDQLPLDRGLVHAAPPKLEPPPYYPGLDKTKPPYSSTSLKPKPLRLVRDSRKRAPPVFYSKDTRTLLQSVSYLRIDNEGWTTGRESVDMASNQTVPKDVPLPSGPRLPGAGVGGGMSSKSKDEILADLRRQVSVLNLPTLCPFVTRYLDKSLVAGPLVAQVSRTLTDSTGGLARRIRLGYSICFLQRPASAQAQQQSSRQQRRSKRPSHLAPAGRHQAGAATTWLEPRRRAGAKSPPARRCFANPPVRLRFSIPLPTSY